MICTYRYWGIELIFISAYEIQCQMIYKDIFSKDTKKKMSTISQKMYNLTKVEGWNQPKENNNNSISQV